MKKENNKNNIEENLKNDSIIKIKTETIDIKENIDIEKKMIMNKIYNRITTHSLLEMKLNREKISMLTAYDYTTAKIIDSSNIDVILVGDSASNVIAGHETTLPITLDEMIYHAKSVIKAVKKKSCSC